MLPQTYHLSAAGLTAGLLGLTATVGLAGLIPQIVMPPAGQVGLVTSELTVDAHTLSVQFAPSLLAENPQYQPVLAPAAGSGGDRMLIAYLESNVALRIGGVEIVVGDRSRARRDLWMSPKGDRWQLQVSDPRAPRGGAVAGIVDLSHGTTSVVSPSFVAALIATGSDTAQLVMRWGEHEWTTEVEVASRFQDQTTRRESVAGNRGDPGVDASAFIRAQRFSSRNETALVLTSAHRISVLFPKALTVTGQDFPQIGSAADGAIIQFTTGAVTRLKTDVPLRFGQTVVNTGNVSPDFSGAYGLWLKRAGPGWRLVFNNEPDAWGTQHDPTFDATEIALNYSQGGGASRPFAVAVVSTGAERGRLVMHWGPHEWFADFVVDRSR